jgi:hypothetical protein
VGLEKATLLNAIRSNSKRVLAASGTGFRLLRSCDLTLDHLGLFGRNQLEKCNQCNHVSWRRAKKSHPGRGRFSCSRIRFWLHLGGIQPGGEIHGVNHVCVPILKALSLPSRTHRQKVCLVMPMISAAEVGLPSSELLDDSLCGFMRSPHEGRYRCKFPAPPYDRENPHNNRRATSQT